MARLLVTRKYDYQVLVEFVLGPLAKCAEVFEHASCCSVEQRCWADLVRTQEFKVSRLFIKFCREDST